MKFVAVAMRSTFQEVRVLVKVIYKATRDHTGPCPKYLSTRRRVISAPYKVERE
jgi:hypothetical protein